MESDESADVKTPDKPSAKEQKTRDENMVTIDELLDIVHEATTTDVGRVMALSLLGMKREHAQEEFRLSDVLNTLNVLPKMFQAKKPGLDVVADLLKGNIDVVTDGKNTIQLDKAAIGKIYEVTPPISPKKAQQKHSDYGNMESPISIPFDKRASTDSSVDSIGLPVYEHGLSASDVTQSQSKVSLRPALGSDRRVQVEQSSDRSDRSDVIESEPIEKRERGASDKVEIADLIGALLSVSDREERKELTKTIVIGALQQPMQPMVKLATGKTKFQKPELVVKTIAKEQVFTIILSNNLMIILITCRILNCF